MATHRESNVRASRSHDSATHARSCGRVLSLALLAACSAGRETAPPPAVTVARVTPNNGPFGGGTTVAITGTNFPATVDSVRVGTGWLVSLVRVSATQLTGITPAGHAAAGAVDVTVYAAGAVVAKCTNCYTYNLVVTGLSPNHGPMTGGTAVTISGNFPVAVGTVQVGATTLASVARVSDTLLSGLTRASNVMGAVDVTVNSTTAGSGSCTQCFRYDITFASGLTAQYDHSCALALQGAAYCWGRNAMGELGDLTPEIRTTPVAVTGGLAFVSLAAGEAHTCGLTSGGATYCWGEGQFGQLGDGLTTSRTVPRAVSGALTFTSLTAGRVHTCGVTRDGKAYCWGSNWRGGLGDGTTTDRLSPVAVVGGLSFTEVSAGAFHTCGLTAGGAAYCWGRNSWGQLGQGGGDTLPSATPLAVTGGITFASLTSEYDHTCGLTAGGVAYCWGSDGSPVHHDSPVVVAGGRTFKALSAGASHACGLTSSGAAYCWGWNVEGELGNGSQVSFFADPVPVAGGVTFTSVRAGTAHTCALTASGTVYCWGDNSFGQLGDGSTTQRRTPVPVVNP